MPKRLTRKVVPERPEAIRRVLVKGFMRVLGMKKTHLSANRNTVEKVEKEVPCNPQTGLVEGG